MTKVLRILLNMIAQQLFTSSSTTPGAGNGNGGEGGGNVPRFGLPSPILSPMLTGLEGLPGVPRKPILRQGLQQALQPSLQQGLQHGLQPSSIQQGLQPTVQARSTLL